MKTMLSTRRFRLINIFVIAGIAVIFSLNIGLSMTTASWHLSQSDKKCGDKCRDGSNHAAFPSMHYSFNLHYTAGIFLSLAFLASFVPPILKQI